jgi:hypothetical protein
LLRKPIDPPRRVVARKVLIAEKLLEERQQENERQEKSAPAGWSGGWSVHPVRSISLA